MTHPWKGRARRGVRAVLALLPLIFFGVPPSHARTAQILFCGPAGQCICVAWWDFVTATLEEEAPRCPPGQAPPPPPTPPTVNTWGGPGILPGGTNPAPGSPIPSGSSMESMWARGRTLAIEKVRRIREPGSSPPLFLPNACFDLFAGNPTGKTGGDLLANYIIPRYGQNMPGSPCSRPGVYAFSKSAATLGAHRPYVYLCDRFTESGRTSQSSAETLIHEALHVAGQLEDDDGSIGPGDPPNSTNINDAVKAACFP